MTKIKLQERGSGDPNYGGRIYQMSVPMWIARKLSWKKGDVLEVSCMPGQKMVVRKAV